MTSLNNLREELLKKRGEIYAQQLTMSVGELISLYEDEEINLEPAFQRLFRWTSQQETDFIESILLGYPIPAIFVLQGIDGVWDIIDGVQRLSTIYHFCGLLKDENGKKVEPLKLESAKILENLEGKYWDNIDSDISFDKATRIDFKRASIPVIILKYESDKSSKYELFRRLNTGGSNLSPAEVRNALILMNRPEVYEKMDLYCKKEEFTTLINVSENQQQNRQDMEILTRYLIFRNYDDFDKVNSYQNTDRFFDDAIEKTINLDSFDIDYELEVFDKLVDFLIDNLENDYGFKVYDPDKERFKGPFIWFVFETIVWGLTVINDIKILEEKKEEVIKTIKKLKSTGEYVKEKGISNPRVIDRIKLAKIYAQEVFGFNE